MVKKWRFIHTGKRNAFYNMAVDEALLLSENPLPVLRFYQWEKKSISIGISQKISTALNVDECVKQNIDIVRRPTGGGVVFHGEEIDFTYSLIVPQDEKYKKIKDSYKIWHEVLILALKKLTIEGIHSQKKADKDIPNVCFIKPTYYDVLVEEKKIAGAAQRRVNEKILHQGYLCLSDRGLEQFLPQKDNIVEKFKTECISLDFLLKEKINRKILEKTIKQSFTEFFSLEFVEGNLDAMEIKKIEEFYTKYSKKKWNYKR